MDGSRSGEGRLIMPLTKQFASPLPYVPRLSISLPLSFLTSYGLGITSYGCPSFSSTNYTNNYSGKNKLTNYRPL